MDKLEAIARELKEQVAQFDPDIFARQMTSYINGITLPWNMSVMKGLVSPFRQLFYLLNLNVTSPTQSYKKHFDQNQDWPALKKKLDEMETIHNHEYGELKPFPEHLFEEMDTEEVVRRRQIGSSTYTAFFHVGPLHYEEQAIEKITEFYKNFDAELTDRFGWNSSHVLAIYDKLDALLQEKQDKAFLKQPKKQLSQDEFKAEILTAMANGSTFQDAMLATSDAPTGMFEYVADPSSTNVFTLDDLDGIPKPLVDLVLQELTVSRYTDNTYLYFSQPNQLYKKPIYCLANGSYLLLDHRVLLSAMSALLQQKCSEIIKNQKRITVARDKYLERKLENIFKVFYQSNPNVKIIPSYYLEKGGNERDLLVLDRKTALIIEAKAGKIREPMYDPDKAYNRIWQDFKDTIDYGYEQAFSVKEKFMAKLPFDIYDKKKNVLMTIDPKYFTHIYTIIVTYNKFGHVQCDLQMMLALFDEDDRYPWATCIDDLEIFLLGLRKQKLTEKDFYRFLHQRADLHGHLIVNDEGQITGQFIKHKRILHQKGTYRFSPEDDYIYDKLYSTGLGFANERRMERKTNPRFLKVV